LLDDDLGVAVGDESLDSEGNSDVQPMYQGLVLGTIVGRLLTVNSYIKVRLDLQADKSPVIVKGPFFARVVNPRYRIRGTMCNARIQSSKAR
jgi:O-succinylbenzoate synthase